MGRSALSDVGITTGLGNDVGASSGGERRPSNKAPPSLLLSTYCRFVGICIAPPCLFLTDLSLLLCWNCSKPGNLDVSS